MDLELERVEVGIEKSIGKVEEYYEPKDENISHTFKQLICNLKIHNGIKL